MSHYDTIGVKPDACAGEIKRVFREKAAKSHPDKGGSEEGMAALNVAYETLIDPKRRLLYDTTGADKETPLEVEVRNVLLQSFTQALMQDAPDALKFVKQMLEQGRQESAAMLTKIETKKEQWTKRRGKITRKKGENAFHMIIDQQLKALAGETMKAETQLKVIDAAIEELKQYKSTEKAPTQFVYSFGGTTTGSQW